MSDATIHTDQIKELMQAFAGCGLNEMRLSQEGFSLVLRRDAAIPAGTAVPAPAPEGSPAPAEQAPAEIPGTIVRSPIVGTYYAAPAPDSPPFVQTGDSVKPGDVLFIIESMKLMNEVTSDCEGVVAEIFAESGDPVEYGQPLMRIE